MNDGEKVGQIYFEVELETARLLSGSKEVNKQIDSMSRGFGKADSAAAKSERQLTKTAAAVKQLGQNAQQVGSAWSSLTRLMAAAVTARAVQAVIAMSDQYGQMASRIRNATSSTDEYEMVQARLLQTANGTYRSLSEAQEVYLSTADTLRDLGYTTAQVLDISDSLSYAFVRDAARADQATTAMDAYSKALMKGKIDADGWASIMAATPSIVKGVAAATGETEAKIKQLGATGKLSIKALNEGLRQSLDENKKMADAMDVAVKDAGVQLRNALTVFIGKVNESSKASGVLTDNVKLLAGALQDPETIKAAQDLASGVVTAFGWMVTSAKVVVKFVKWMSEEVAASMHGIASDDIDRLQKKAEMLRLKLGARQGFFLGWGSAGIKKELAETEALIADFRQRQGARDAQAARDAMAMISDPGAGGGRPRKKTKAEGEGTGGKTKSGTEWPVDTLQVYQADQLREAFEKIGKINDEWQPVSYVDSANLHEAEMLRKAFEEIGELNKDVAASVKDAGKVGAEVGQDLALVFSSAAGAAITNWQGVGSLLKGILQDLAQIALREAVTKPLTGMLTTALTSFLPKFDVGTDYVPRDMAAIVHKGERIVPAAQNLRDRSAGGGRSGGIVLNSAPSIRIDARTDVGAVAQMVAQGMRVANEQMLMELKSAGVMG